LAQPPDFGQRRLLGRFRFQVLAVVGSPGAERDIANAPALAPFVAKRVAGFSPIASATEMSATEPERTRFVIESGNRICHKERTRRGRSWKSG
jgi:hypothetical protein